MEAAGSRRADRELSWMMSLGGLVLAAGQTLGTLSAAADFAPWWNAGGIVVAGIVLGLGALGRWLPDDLLRFGWVVAPTMNALLMVTAFAAYHGTDPGQAMPWAWTLEPVVVCYLVLWTPPAVAIIAAAISAMLPAFSGLVFLGEVPALVAANTPAHISNLALVALFLGIRSRLTRMRVAQELAQQEERRVIRAEADARRKDALARVVHDEVLSVLTAAMALPDRPPAELRAEAEGALLLLDRATAGGLDGTVRSSREALAELVDHLRMIDPGCDIRPAQDVGQVPAEVVDTLGRAAAEALRNSVRHAGPDATRTVRIAVAPQRVDITVSDDGRGFDPAAVDPARLGLRTSIVAAVEGLPGGRVRLDTAPGRGTRVELSWSQGRAE